MYLYFCQALTIKNHLSMKTFCLSVFCLFSASLYSQSEWDYVTSSNDSSDWYVKDIKKIKNTSSDDFDFWVKIADSKKFNYKDGSATIKKFTSAVFHYNINCSKKQYTILSSIEYNYKGIAVSNNDEPVTIEVFPDTVAESIYNYICSKP